MRFNRLNSVGTVLGLLAAISAWTFFVGVLWTHKVGEMLAFIFLFTLAIKPMLMWVRLAGKAFENFKIAARFTHSAIWTLVLSLFYAGWFHHIMSIKKGQAVGVFNPLMIVVYIAGFIGIFYTLIFLPVEDVTHIYHPNQLKAVTKVDIRVQQIMLRNSSALLWGLMFLLLEVSWG